MNITRAGQNTLICEYPDSSMLTIKAISETTVDAVYEGIINIDGDDSSCVLNFTLQKSVEDENEVTASPTTNVTEIEGIWLGSNGSGSATGPDGNFDLQLVSTKMSFNDVYMNGSEGNMYAASSSIWDIYQNGVYVRTIFINNNKEFVSVSRDEENVWSYNFPSSENGADMWIIHENSAVISEGGSFVLESGKYSYVAYCNAAKQ